MWSRGLVLLAAATAWLGCAQASSPPLPTRTRPLAATAPSGTVPTRTDREQPAASASPLPQPTPSSTPLAPLEAAEPFVELPLPDAHAAVVSLPLGSVGPKPVLVATHGAGGRASTHCALWRGVVENRAFVVCPRGTAIYPHGPPHATGYFYNGHPALGVEITKALAALAARYPERVDLEDPVFAGYSQGANMGALLLPTHAARFARAVLWEGGVGEFQEWNIRVSERFFERGGRRVVLACGRPVCFENAQRTSGFMLRGGLATQLVYVAGAGHTYAGELGERVRDAFAWLVEGDPRW